MCKQSVLSWSLLPVLFASLCAAQAPSSTWQQQVRNYAENQDWDSAMRIVEEQISRSPHDMDVRSWRARILSWSGRLNQAEHEYLQILAIVPNDPDNWAGLGSVYLRQGRTQDALHALDRAVALDGKRADLHVARARIFIILNQGHAAEAEFESALVLDPNNQEARNGIASVKAEARHQLLFGTSTDLFSFIGADQQESINLISRWNRHWETYVGGSFYSWAGLNAQKFNLAVAGKSARLGSLTLGGAVANDNGIIPQNEAFFSYDRGWRISGAGVLRGLETTVEPHWYWYSTARVLTLNGTTIAYFPRDWMWSLRLTGANSRFPGAAAEWRPAGLSKLSFPLNRVESHQLGGNVFFATGTENYAQVDQIGHFSSHTYGGGLHFQLAAAQDVSGFAGYETRSAGQTQITFGLTYGIRF
jgi:tetratricopeptide (TPR) repeat protein